MTIVTTMVKLFAAMLLGLVLGKKDIFDPATCKKLSRVIVNVTGPALVLCSVASTEGTEPKLVMTAFVFGVACYLVLPFLGFAFAKAMRVEKGLTGTYILTILLCNNAFMGFPVVQAMLGEEAIFFTSILHFSFNIMFYALGLALVRRDVSLESGEKFKVRSLFNSGTIAAILVMIVFFGKLPLPEIVSAPLSFVGNLTMPLSMIIIGANMAQYSLKEVFADKRMYALALMRLVLVPLAIYVVMMALHMDMYLVKVATITFGMPVAALVAMATAPYEKQGKVGAVAVAFTTICSLVTIPIWAVFMGI